MDADERRLASAAKQAVMYRNYRRARDRALIKLSHLHPDEYKVLLEKEKERDEAEGKKWTSLAGRGRGSNSADPRTRSSGSVIKQHTPRGDLVAANQGDLEGEE